MGKPDEAGTVTYYTEVGAALGAAFGAALSRLFGDSGMAIPIGLALGVAFGSSVGLLLERKRLAAALAERFDNEGST